MSHIIKFSIEGLAGRKDTLTVDLNRDDNIFFGLNGCGKTSLLKILHSAMSNQAALLHSVPFKAAQVEIYSVKYNKVFTRSIQKTKSINHKRNVVRKNFPVEGKGSNEFIALDILEDVDFKWSCTPDKPAGVVTSNWNHEYLPTTRLHVSEVPVMLSQEYLKRPESLTEEKLDMFFAQSVEYLWNRYSAQVLGAVRIAQEQGLASILRVVLSTEKARQHSGQLKLTSITAYERVKNFLARQGSAQILGSPAAFDKRYKDDSTLQDVVQDIDSVETKIETAMASRNRLQELITRMFKGNKTISFTDSGITVQTLDGEMIGLGSLSSGEKHLLRILVQALLVGESSLLIDEPEISLHVDWQRDLIQCMRALNSKAQFIFATHSPEVMANIEDSKIFRL